MKLNLGCGPDILEGFVNVDIRAAKGIEYWDSVKNVVPGNWENKFDFILINHMLCTMNNEAVRTTLKKVHSMLVDGGKVQVIDVDIRSAFNAYNTGQDFLLPIGEGDIDDKLCLHLSGYGTRLSLFTPKRLSSLLEEAGFSTAVEHLFSEYNHRPHESLIVEATK